MSASTASTTRQTSARVSVGLTTWSRHHVATIELDIRLDSISVWCGYIEYALMGRDEFRNWLDNPESMFAVDQVVWSMRGEDLCISLNSGPTYPIGRDMISHVHDVI